MKTLAEAKRTIKVGQVWHAYHHLFKRDMGNRTITRVQSNAIALLQPDGRESWLHWPKAKDFRPIDEKSFAIYEDDERVLTYELVEDV